LAHRETHSGRQVSGSIHWSQRCQGEDEGEKCGEEKEQDQEEHRESDIHGGWYELFMIEKKRQTTTSFPRFTVSTMLQNLTSTYVGMHVFVRFSFGSFGHIYMRYIWGGIMGIIIIIIIIFLQFLTNL
jgi:hypothetical protein